jgi:hypothetical protein
MAPAAGRIDLYLIWFDDQRLSAGISQSKLGGPAPGPGPVFLCIQGCLSGHSHPVVILWRIACSRVAAQTGCQ